MFTTMNPVYSRITLSEQDYKELYLSCFTVLSGSSRKLRKELMEIVFKELPKFVCEKSKDEQTEYTFNSMMHFLYEFEKFVGNLGFFSRLKVETYAKKLPEIIEKYFRTEHYFRLDEFWYIEKVREFSKEMFSEIKK